MAGDELSTLEEVSPGVSRVRWTMAVQQAGLGPATAEVSRAIAAGFERGAHRIEAYVSPSNVMGQRIATFCGMRKEGIARGIHKGVDRIVYARLVDDVPVDEPEGFRALLNSFLPRKRAISQLLIRDRAGRVLMCELTYKRDHDLPGGVVEVEESPQLAVSREVEEELALRIPAGPLLLTDWLPPWSGWEDAVCLVFDGGVHDAAIADQIVRQAREIKSAAFESIESIRESAADFTARRVEAALRRTRGEGPAYTESGR